ncbi:hypothetical protein GCM10009844_22160 [Nocardioides koreensis]|uniref:J domain-containing protein n=1 Tax=Nocardioides koreensis TaxID=433651 RepID=A0ABP5LFC3_9ACTN
MTPSWYDLLDVAPDASEAEIRAAWKAAIVDLDPTDRRFRVYNQAAEVLLDPKRRAQHDAELASQPTDEEGPVAAATAPGAGAAGGLVGRLHRSRKPKEATPAPSATPVTHEDHSLQDRTRRGVPGWALAVLAVLTAASVGVAAWLWFEVPSDAAVQESTRAAQGAAERAIGPILSYDYRHLDEDQAAAESYMTSGYRDDYDKLFAVVKQNAPGIRTVVTGKVVSSGIVRSGSDRVEVLLFVDQPTTNKQHKTPVVYKNQVRVQMEKVDGDWLVDCLITTPNGHCD